MIRGWMFAVLIAVVPQARGEDRPNVVFLLADDLGRGDLGCYGHPYAKTPNIDRLAKEGTRFNQFYATGVTCCPARTGLMTSKFPAGFAKYPAGHGFGTRPTITDILKKSGYATGHFGKWHIGSDPKPGVYGIDELEGDAPGRRRVVLESGRDAPIYDAATRFIEKHKNEPFYVNVWGHSTHNPVNPPKAFADRFKGVAVKESDFGPTMRTKFARIRRLGGDVDQAMRNYLGDVAALDDAVGRLLKRIDELGLRERTIVVFSSDQGPAPLREDAEGPALNLLGSADPYRGGKHEQTEGGLRVPFIVRWPARVPADRLDETSVIAGVDWLPTLAALTGEKLAVNDFDGENALDAWLGKAPHVRTKPLLWKTSAPRAPVAIREGVWKLYAPSRPRGEVELYDVLADPAETKNLAATRPEIVKSLRAKADAWNAGLPKAYDKTGAKED